MSEAMESPYLSLQNINLKIKNQQLFSDFSLTVNKGEAVLLKGKSGKGKSTLLKMIPGFMKFDSGSIILEGKELNRHNLKYFRERISYVSQDTDLRNENVEQLLQEILKYKANRHISCTPETFRDLIREFHLEEDTPVKKIRELSGGERQRLGIILTIILDRDIWIMDEITSAMDPELKKLTAEKLLSLNKTLILTSHDSQWENDPRVRVVEL
ncbi:MAG: ATP-binding cassette domain-containing protein [Spirochaetales bacterium]|nr:ATP-binding cassette domain-containing protein [Spirochaetales bacterium]